MKASRIILFAFLFCWESINLNSQTPCNISGACGPISAVGGVGVSGPTIFCEGQTVPFDNQSDPASVDSSFIDWGDGSSQAFKGTPDVTHTYDFPNDTCINQIGIIITLTVIRHCANGVSRHCSFIPLAIKFPPVPKFSPDGDFCVGEPIFMDNETCENADSTAYQWDFGNDSTSIEFNPTTYYDAPGFYTINLTATNDCGVVDTQRIIQIRDKPVINAIFDTLMPATGCVPTVVHLGASTTYVTGFTWSVSADPPCSNCVEFIDSTTKNYVKPHLRFTKAGVYTVLLTGTNECGTDTMSKQIVIHDPPAVTVPPPAAACNSLSFTPNPVYTGTVTNYQWSFPKGFPNSSNTAFPTNIQYTQSDTATLIVTGPCGADTAIIPISVLQPVTVVFNPVGVVCDHYAPFQLVVTPSGGSFSGPGVSPGGLFNPALANPGPNIIHYEHGPAGCQSVGDLLIDVKQGTPVSTGPDTTLCIDNDTLTLSFSPTGGTWSGPGIINAMQGIFDPAAANAGTAALLYTYTDPATQCVSTGDVNVEVVALPAVNAPDTVYTCDVPGDILLTQIGNFTFLPAVPGATYQWSGPGITNAQTGTFSSTQAGGVGNYSHSVTYTIPPGCKSTDLFIVKVSDFVAAQLSAPAQLCSSLGNYQLTASPGGGIFIGPGVDSNTGVIDFAQAGNGIKQYIYTIQKGTPCESSDTIQLEIVNAQGVNAGNNLYACDTEDTVILPAGSPASGVWTGPVPINGNTADISALGQGNYVFYYTVASFPPACNHDSITLTIEPLPDAGFSHDSTGCIGKSVLFTANSTGDIFNWNFGDNGASTLANPSHTYQNAGDFPVTLQVTTLNQLTGQPLCVNSSGSTIHIYENPEVFDFQVDTDNGCEILTVTFQNNSIAESGTYMWVFGNGDTSYAYQPGPVSYKAGIEDTTYTATLYLFAPCDTLAMSRTITVLPQPKADFGITYNDPCSGGVLLLNNTSTGNPVNNTWYTSKGGPYLSFNPPPLVFYTDSLPEVVTISLVASNPCGTDTVQKLVTVNPTDVEALFNISDTSALCVGDTLTLTNFSTPGAPVHWADSEGNTYLGNQIPVPLPVADTFQITLYAEGCGYDSMNVKVTVNPLPELTVTHDAAACEGAPVQFNVLTDAPGHTLWFGDGAFSLLNQPTHIYSIDGQYVLQAEAVSLKGCRQVWSGPLEVMPRPVSVLVAADSACSGQAVAFSSAGAGNNTCIWYFGDSTSGDGCQTSHVYANGGLYAASLVVVSPAGCRDTSTQPVYVRPTPAADFNFQIVEKCSPALVIFQNASSGATGIQWQFGDGTTGNTGIFEKTYNQGGDYPVMLIASYEAVCFDTALQTVKVFQTPALDISITEHCTIAEGTDLSIETSGANWVQVSGQGYQQTGDFHSRLSEGNYAIQIKSPEGCVSDTTVLILEPDELFISLKQDSFDIRLGESAELEVTANQSGVVFAWSPVAALDDPASPNPTATPWLTTTYVVAVTNMRNCSKTDTAFIRVEVDREAGIFIPNAFSPNDDGHNELFFLRSSNPALTILPHFRIFDKWGEVMHSATDCLPDDPACGWDGRLRGQKAEAGVYRYEMLLRYVDGVEVSKKGSLMLIR